MAAAPMAAARPARAAVSEPAVQATFDETLARYGAEIYRFALHLTRNGPTRMTSIRKPRSRPIGPGTGCPVMPTIALGSTGSRRTRS